MQPSKDSKAAMQAWHPNFRIEATLPDTKVIRTSFLVNAAAAILMLGVGYLLVQRELSLRETDAGIAELNKEMSTLNERYKVAVPLQKQFAELEKKYQEVETFRKGAWGATQFLERISTTLPRFVTVDGLEVTKDFVTLRGNVAGAPDRAAGVFNAYLETLSKDEVIAGMAENVRQRTINRDPQTNRLNFTIEMKPKIGK